MSRTGIEAQRFILDNFREDLLLGVEPRRDVDYFTKPFLDMQGYVYVKGAGVIGKIKNVPDNELMKEIWDTAYENTRKTLIATNLYSAVKEGYDRGYLDEDLDDVDQNERIVRTYDNATAQATYGIITKHEDIDTKDTLPSGPFTEADAYAQKYLNERADPVLTVRIDGYELSKYTGDSWDEAQIGTLCRVAVPDYATFISERLTQVNYPDVFGLPGKVTVTLSNATSKYLRDQEDLSSTMESQQAEVRRLGGGGHARAAGINVDRIRMLSVIMSTWLAAVGILVYEQGFGFIQLYMAPFYMALPAVSAILIGGASVNKASIMNVIIGTILFQGIVTMTPTVMNNMIHMDMSEVIRIIVSNGMILYALTRKTEGSR